jgi:hypothetical protein
MPNKHVIFLVHGMGTFDATWSATVQKTLTDQYATYPQINFIPFDQRFAFAPIVYDDEFAALRKQWSDSAASLGTAIAASGIAAPIVTMLDNLASGTKKDTFINTHVLDVVLYHFTALTTSTVRESVRHQIFDALAAQDLTQPLNWSIIAHSLGTSVIHDALHEAYSDVPTKYGEKLAGITRPTLLAMIANVSRVLETDSDVYLSRTRPGNPNDPDAACKYYLNAHHQWDPITQPKAFRPATQWPSLGVRAMNLYVDVEISEIEKLNVHDFNHYLRNPLVHIPIFNCMLDNEVIDQHTLDVAHGQFAAHTPLSQFGQFVTKLKPFQLGEEEEWMEIVTGWSGLLQL